MKVLTSSQMRSLDTRAIKEFGIIGPILMENAGLEIAKEILHRFPKIADENIVIVAGKGNNGGDGFVVARHLYNRGAKPHVLLLSPKKEVKGDAGLNLSIIDKMGIAVTEIESEDEWSREKANLEQASLIIDAIFGTGLTEPAKGFYALVIEDINQVEAFTVAVDIPSGLSADSFQVIGPCVRADLTVTMAAPKIAHVFAPSEEWMGELAVADISMPPLLFKGDDLKLEMVEKDLILPYFLDRRKDTHKGTYGHLFIVSGSFGKTGAAVMAGKAALKMGAGLVTVGTPQSCLPMVARGMVELMTEPLDETPEGTLASQALEQVMALSEGKDAVMIGPGISSHESTAELVLSLLPRLKIPIVLDADALNIVASQPEVLKSISPPVVMTPHPGEFARLLNVSAQQVVKEKLELVPRFAQEYGVFLVLKGYKTLTAAPDGMVFINPTGNPGMATGGSGDVLSGMIASMIMQSDNLLEALLAAVYVHGLSGDMAVEKIGEKPLIASNITSYLPLAIKALGSK